MSRSGNIVEDLRHTLDQDEGLAGRIETSLVEAGRLAEAELRSELFDVLDWPQNLAQYEAYLEDFIRWVPRQSDAAAWKNQAPRDRYAKEVSDRLAHFFFLIDQNTGENRRAVQSSGRFQDWLTEFARQWGSFLDTTESFSQDILRSFLDDAPEYTIGASTGDRTCRADG